MRPAWKRIQSELRRSLITESKWDGISNMKYIGGVDLSFVGVEEEEKSIQFSQRACASLIIMTFPDLNVVYEDYQMVTLDLPYMYLHVRFSFCLFTL